MNQNYSHISTFQCNHQYFRDGIFKSIDISLDEGTVKLTRNLGIIIKSFSGGFHLLASNPEILNSENEGEPLRFYLSCKDPYYINYTVLPTFGLINELLYFNNLTIGFNPQRPGLPLHEDEFAGKNDIVSASHGKVTIPNYDPVKTYSFRDSLGNQLAEESVAQNNNNPDEFILSNVKEGLVRLFEDSKEVARVYYCPKAIWKKPLGIIELYLPQLFDRYNNQGKQGYTLDFYPRRTIWKYFLMDPTYKRFEDLSILDSNKDLVFNPPQKEWVQEAEALVFESKNKIALSEFSENSFQLVDQFDTALGSGKVVIRTLPRASPEQLFRNNSTSGETMYSHIYI